MNPQRILVLQLKRIGDLILTAPALADLRHRFPGAEIELVADYAYRDLAACLPGLTRVLPYRSGGVNAAVWASVALGPWDACLDFTGTDRTALITALSGATRRIGYQRSSGKGLRARAYTELSLASVRDLHTVDFHRALVAQLTAESHLKEVMEGTPLQLSERLQARIDRIQREIGLQSPFAILHPGTARREKFWPADRWVKVAECLHTLGFQVVVTGTGSGLERDDVQYLIEHTQTPLYDLTGRLKLAEMAALMQRADLAVGVDSMAMHLAALWKIPQVVLFGPTNPFHWRPLHAQAQVIVPNAEHPLHSFDPRRQGGGMTQIQTRAVLEALNQRFAAPQSN